MAEIILKIVNVIVISAVIFFLIAFVAILLGRRRTLPPDQRGPDFSELCMDYAGVPELQSFTARDGTETLSYSYRLNTAYSPRNYKKDLRAITQPLLVVVGTADEASIAEKFESVISQHTEARVRLIEGLTHGGVVLDPEVRPVIREWLEGVEQRRHVSV